MLLYRLISKASLRTMSTSTSTLAPKGATRVIPAPIHRGMTKLDRSAFKTQVKCLAARVDERDVAKVSKDVEIRKHLLNIPRTKNVAPDPNTSTGRLLLLDVEAESDLPQSVQAELSQKTKGLVPFVIDLQYDHWQASDILEAVLPEDLLPEAPQAFTITGHIAHLNLKDEYLPYKYLIGQVILDKNKNIRTVVNKLDSIDTEFRVFKMEVLAGDDDFVAQAKESNCTFTFDFSKVYWNSRLSHEHERLVQDFFKEGEVVADVMAGVGPFAIPAAKKRCFVLGNDLNPDSSKWMEKNRVDNKVEAALRVSNLDGRAFIKSAPLEAWRRPFKALSPLSALSGKQLEKLKRKQREAVKATGSSTADQADISKLQQSLASSALSDSAHRPASEEQARPQTISHFVMNLPNSALEFLDAYSGCYTPLLKEEGFPGQGAVEMPLVHTHCFTRELEPDTAEKDICERASGYLAHPVDPKMDGFLLHYVRGVAPNKHMYCLTFRLPREVAYR